MTLTRMLLPMVIVATVAVAAASSSTDAMQYSDIRTISFYLCQPDPECARRFFIDRRALDYNRFLYLFDRYVAETESKQFLLNEFDDDSVKKGWLITMRRASFCTENEVLDSEGYCVCRNGKVCHETSGDVFSYDTLSLYFLCTVVIVSIVYYSTLHLSQFRYLLHNVRRLSRVYLREDARAAVESTATTLTSASALLSAPSSRLPPKDEVTFVE